MNDSSAVDSGFHRPRAVVLLSGGLDSATVLAMARRDGFQNYCLSFDYGQRHRAELVASERIAQALQAAEHRTFRLDIGQFGGSALTDAGLDVPDAGTSLQAIPITYVPARNTVFLSIALAWAEVLGAQRIYIGVNAVDYSGYPDCRPEFVNAFETLARLATRSGVEGQELQIQSPLISLSKAEIIRAGSALGVDYSQTVSCYRADEEGRACGRCDACQLRREGFASAGLSDPTRYMGS